MRSLLSNQDKLLQFLEYWSGRAEMTRQHIALGLRAAAFDKLYAPNQDVTTPEGLRLWLDTLTATEKDSTHWNGTRCSSFGGMCKAQSGRRMENLYTGHTFRAFVRDGNRQADCLSLLVFFSCLVQNEPILEQPAGSVLPKMVPLKTVFQYFHILKTSLRLGAYGAESMKPLQLWHRSPCYKQLRKSVPFSRVRPLVRLAKPFIDKKGKKRFTGDRHALKGSQEYPRQFSRLSGFSYCSTHGLCVGSTTF